MNTHQTDANPQLQTFCLFFISGVVTTLVTLNWLGLFRWQHSKASLFNNMREIAVATTATTNAATKTKMVLVVRNDLKMGKGKIGAQCAHGAVGAVHSAERHNNLYLDTWYQEGQRKVTLKEESEAALLNLEKQARRKGLTTNLVYDAGKTQIQAGSLTVLAIGPGLETLIDEVTGHLKLL